VTVVATVRDRAKSQRWVGAAPALSVVVSTHSRATYLTGMLDALEQQTDDDFEVVVADNGSTDGTWEALVARCAGTPLRLAALRLDPHDGPAVPRNTAVTVTRAPWLAFTDDDCLPAPGWVAAIRRVAAPGVTVVQGRTEPEPGGWGGPWGRTLHVPAASGLYETANLACPRDAFEQAGGFPAERLLTGRAFGEDVLLGARLARAGSVRPAPEALVHHRVIPGTYRQFLSERSRLEGFPTLTRHVPELRERFLGGVFLSRRTMLTDVGVAGLVTAAAVRHPAPALTALPWLVHSWRAAARRPGRPRPVRAAQLAVADVVGLVALVRGSVRARRLVL
jgi:glycosyltransferase involved in cell wall biosynthesis